MSLSAPVIIAGGSLAGLATAIRLKQHGIEAWIFEKSRFPRKKLCGEFLSPDSFRPLAILGLWEHISNKGYGPIKQAIFYPQSNKVGSPLIIPFSWLNPYQPYGLGITRSTLDTLIMDFAKEQGISIFEQHKILSVKTNPPENDFEITLQPHDSTQQTFNTPVFINASGRHGVLTEKEQTLANALNSNKSKKQLVGFKANIKLNTSSQEKTLKMFFFPNGYGGIQPLSEEIHNVCFLLAPTNKIPSQHHFSELISNTIGQNKVAMALLENADPIEPFQTTANLNLKPLPFSQIPYIRVGDAMLTIDPFTGSGMALALQTGILAADIIAEGIKRGLPYFETKKLYYIQYQQLIAQRLWYLKLFRPFLFSPMSQQLLWPLAHLMLKPLAQTFR